MKISRYTAPDMRQALRAVRERLGEDAVILSSRRTAEGVEITAAMDFDADSMRTAAENSVLTAAPPATAMPAAMRAAMPAATPAATGGGASRREPPQQAATATATATATASVAATAAAVATAARAATPARQPAAAAAVPAPVATNALARGIAAAIPRNIAQAVHPAAGSAVAAAGALPPLPPPSSIPTILPATEASATVGRELKTLRRMLETQLAQLAWKDLTQRAPVHTEMLRELTEIGLAQELAAGAVARLPPGCDASQARRLIAQALCAGLPVTGDRWLESGGRVALIGPTGVGKTTTLAKLAVRWVLRHGARELALVAADTVRIGAQDQVRSLGQLLGVPVFAPSHLQDLPAALARLERFRFVLVDTPGAGQRDAQLSQRLALLAEAGPQLQTALVLATTTQAGALEEVVQRFAAAGAASCVLTKMDEAASLGGTLSILTRARLPVAYVSDGQRVPEDLRPARCEELVACAVQLARTSGAAADEDLLKRRFGEVAHALA